MIWGWGTKKQLLCLEILEQSRDWMTGQEIVALSGGKLKRGAIYTILNRLEDRGEVESRFEPIILMGQIYQKGYYRITQAGRRRRVDQFPPLPDLMPGLS